MVRKLNDHINALSADKEGRVHKRFEELKAEEKTLQQLRKAYEQSQKKVAAELDLNQGTISRVERSTDMLISTLQSYVGAMGGEVHVMIEMPDHKMYEVKQFEGGANIESSQ